MNQDFSLLSSPAVLRHALPLVRVEFHRSLGTCRELKASVTLFMSAFHEQDPAMSQLPQQVSQPRHGSSQPAGTGAVAGGFLQAAWRVPVWHIFTSWERKAARDLVLLAPADLGVPPSGVPLGTLRASL